MIKSTIQMTDLTQLTSRFDELGDVLKNRAANRAVSRTFTKARKDAVQVVRSGFRIRSNELKQAAFKLRISGGTGEMELTANRIGLGYFNPQQRKTGVSVAVTQTTASRISLNGDNLFKPVVNSRGRQTFVKRQQRKIIKGAFILPKSKMKYTAGMRQGEASGVFASGRSGQIRTSINAKGKAKASRVRKIKRLFTISTAEMIASSGVAEQINNTIVNEFSRIYEGELRGFVSAISAGRIRKL